MFRCPGCAGKDFEIRYGGKGLTPPPIVTCAQCRKTWWLSASWPEGVMRLIEPLPGTVSESGGKVVIGSL
jgi:hypothetical protein